LPSPPRKRAKWRQARGFPLTALKGIGPLCRTAGLIGHLTEEAELPIGFILSGAAAKAIEL
jgi:citrate synthase